MLTVNGILEPIRYLAVAHLTQNLLTNQLVIQSSDKFVGLLIVESFDIFKLVQMYIHSRVNSFNFWAFIAFNLLF